MGILNQIWYRGGTEEQVDYIGDVLKIELVSESQVVHVGTDAQKTGRKTDFVTVICLHDEEARKGGRVWYTRSRMRPNMEIKEKLWQETWLSLEVALGLVTEDKVCSDQIMVHIDANPEKNARGEFAFESGHYANTLASMVMGNGFKYVLKPDAWAASHGADHLVKNRHLTAMQKRGIRRGRRRKRPLALAR